nr:hypothetical protein HmN_000000500 [Hymenolepis microstoma]
MPECVTPTSAFTPPTSAPLPAILLTALHSCNLLVGIEAFAQCTRIIALLFAPHQLQLLPLLSPFTQSRRNFTLPLISSMHTTHRLEVPPPPHRHRHRHHHHPRNPNRRRYGRSVARVVAM